MGIADDFAHIAAQLKQIEADKAKARSKPAEPVTKPAAEPSTWASYLFGDFDPA